MRRLILILFALLFFSSGFAQKKGKSVVQPAQSLARGDSAFVAGNYVLAIPSYEAALKDPKISGNVQNWYRLGLSYHNSQDFGRALEAYKKAEVINARYSNLRILMARAFSATGDVGSATLRLDSALRQGFGNYKILEQHADFENFRKSSGFASIRERAYVNAYPCYNNPVAHAFDFWLGDWDVYMTSNMSVKTGFNRITTQSGGCVLLESWESQGPHSGVSINYFDPTSSKWQQKWAGSGQDILEFYDGEYKDGAMRFRWDGTGPDGTKFPGRLTFTNLENGKVRQHSQRSTDGGATWVDVYDFTYIRRK